MKALRLAVAFLAMTSSGCFTFCALTLVSASCKGAQSADQAAAVEEAAYESELIRCVSIADAHAEVQPCRCAVDVKFQVDGGNCK